jgi:hypothetical protein
MPSFFLSYRRDDSAGFAGRLADSLEAAFGAGSVFRDIDDIRPGQDFVDVINEQLRSACALLVMIGPRWLEVGADGKRRLDAPDDFVCCEIEAGLASGKPVIPLLVGGAKMPDGKDLPEAIASLVRRQSVVLADVDWRTDTERLVARLRELSSAGPQATVQVTGRWSAHVQYDWGDQYDEVFEFKYLANTLHGTTTFQGGRLTIEQAKLEGEWLSFATRSFESMGGSSEPKELVHRYIGQLMPDGISFTLEISGGYSLHTPVEFVARRAPDSTHAAA